MMKAIEHGGQVSTKTLRKSFEVTGNPGSCCLQNVVSTTVVLAPGMRRSCRVFVSL